MDERITRAQQLRVYQIAFELAMTIFHRTSTFPAEERYSLTDQIRRSSRSVCANLEEAWRKRRYPSAFVAKLSDCEAEAAETAVWLDFAFRCGYLSEAEHARLHDESDHVVAQLVQMIRRPESWTIPH